MLVAKHGLWSQKQRRRLVDWEEHLLRNRNGLIVPDAQASRRGNSRVGRGPRPESRLTKLWHDGVVNVNAQLFAPAEGVGSTQEVEPSKQKETSSQLYSRFLEHASLEDCGRDRCDPRPEARTTPKSLLVPIYSSNRRSRGDRSIGNADSGDVFCCAPPSRSIVVQLRHEVGERNAVDVAAGLGGDAPERQWSRLFCGDGGPCVEALQTGPRLRRGHWGVEVCSRARSDSQQRCAAPARARFGALWTALGPLLDDGRAMAVALVQEMVREGAWLDAAVAAVNAKWQNPGVGSAVR